MKKKAKAAKAKPKAGTKKVEAKSVPVKVDRKQKRREQKQAQSQLEIKKELREKSVNELKVDIADFYTTVEQAEGMKRQAENLHKQAVAMESNAKQNIAVRREIIAEKG